jgi:uncharacterized protein with HEPN domain
MKVPRAKRKKRSYKYLLEDMREAMDSVLSFTENITLDQFLSNKLISDAVIRNFEVMGEASKNVPFKVQNRYPDIPWKKFQMLRNFLAHQYFGVDLNLVWRIAKDHIPAHIMEMDRIIKREKYHS